MFDKIFKSLIPVVLFSFTIPLLVVAQEEAPQFGYVGTKACGMCHKSEKQGKQLKIWEESIHAQAYTVLQSEEANKISQELLGKNAIEAEECLRCHVTGYNVDKSLLGKKFKIEDGVQCETCHGPGSKYKSLKVMKDKEKAVANGLIVPENIQEFCQGCHNSESPTFTEFKFEEMWAKIKHYKPAKK